jgi:hypothetical protein
MFHYPTRRSPYDSARGIGAHKHNRHTRDDCAHDSRADPSQHTLIGNRRESGTKSARADPSAIRDVLMGIVSFPLFACLTRKSPGRSAWNAWHPRALSSSFGSQNKAIGGPALVRPLHAARWLGGSEDGNESSRDLSSSLSICFWLLCAVCPHPPSSRCGSSSLPRLVVPPRFLWHLRLLLCVGAPLQWRWHEMVPRQSRASWLYWIPGTKPGDRVMSAQCRSGLPR